VNFCRIYLHHMRAPKGVPKCQLYSILGYFSCIMFSIYPSVCPPVRLSVRLPVRLPVRLSARLFICYQTCEHYILKMNEPISMQIGVSGPRGINGRPRGSEGQWSRSQEMRKLDLRRADEDIHVQSATEMLPLCCPPPYGGYASC